MTQNTNTIQASVVIPTWNAASFVEQVLSTLVKQEGVQFEVLVVDNGVVNGDTEKVVTQFQQNYPYIHYVGEKVQLGYAGAVNLGAKLANSPLVAILNNDNIPDPLWLKVLVDTIQTKQTAIVCSFVDRPGIDTETSQGFFNYCARVIYTPGRRNKSIYPVFHPDGSAFIFDRRLLGEPYDAEYFLYHEDVSIGWRAHLMGYAVLMNENSRASSFDGGSTKRIPYKTAFYTERNRWLNYLRYPSGANLFRFLPLWIIDGLAGLLISKNRKAKLHAWAWLLSNFGYIWKLRADTQAIRKVSDEIALSQMSLKYRGGEQGVPILDFCVQNYLKLTGFRKAD